MARGKKRFMLVRERLAVLKIHMSYLESFLVELEDDLNAVDALTARIEALQATVEGLEARIAAECKHSEEVWEVAHEWKLAAQDLARYCNENEVAIPSWFAMRDIPQPKRGDSNE